MDVAVIMKMVPDIVEELTIDSSGKKLDTQWLRLIPNELDEHALEQALIMKEKYGGSITVFAIEAPEVDNALFASFAKGADKVVKIKSGLENPNVSTSKEIIGSVLKNSSYDAILLGVQAIDDLDGDLGTFLASKLDLPYIGVTTKIEFDKGSNVFIASKAFAGGLQGVYEVPSPAIFSVQSAERPPRYVPVAKVRKAKKTVTIEEVDSKINEDISKIEIVQMIPPKLAKSTEFIKGSSEEIASKICDILAKEGIL